jgi:signal transduction histidine kinase
MSHEIRTPVNGIIGFSQLLGDNSITDEKRNEYIEIIRANADSLISLIDDILDVSIIQEGQVKLRKTTVNINLLLDEIFSNFLSPRYKEKGLELEIKKSLPDETATITTDPLRVKQILNNLISNAFKFTEKGKIEFGYISEPNFIKFYIKDTGIGISQEKQDAIFMRFIQADASFTRRFGGSGLGLAISKGLVEILGGQISVISKVGEGSEFCFTLPNTDNNWKSPETLVESAKTNPSLLN